MKVYYAVITDNNNKPVLQLEYTASAKHAAFLGQQYVNRVPPAQGFNCLLNPSDAADHLTPLKCGCPRVDTNKI